MWDNVDIIIKTIRETSYNNLVWRVTLVSARRYMWNFCTWFQFFTPNFVVLPQKWKIPTTQGERNVFQISSLSKVVYLVWKVADECLSIELFDWNLFLNYWKVLCVFFFQMVKSDENVRRRSWQQAVFSASV